MSLAKIVFASSRLFGTTVTNGSRSLLGKGLPLPCVFRRDEPPTTRFESLDNLLECLDSDAETRLEVFERSCSLLSLFTRRLREESSDNLRGNSLANTVEMRLTASKFSGERLYSFRTAGSTYTATALLESMSSWITNAGDWDLPAETKNRYANPITTATASDTKLTGRNVFA